NTMTLLIRFSSVVLPPSPSIRTGSCRIDTREGSAPPRFARGLDRGADCPLQVSLQACEVLHPLACHDNRHRPLPRIRLRLPPAQASELRLAQGGQRD